MLTPYLLAVLSAAAPGQRELVDRVAAVVNDDIITLSEVQAAAKPYASPDDGEERKKMLYADILDQLINERLLGQQIKEAQIDVTDDEVERAMQDILRQNKITEEELKQAVEARGMSVGEYKVDLKSQLIRLKLIDLKVRSRVVVPESDIRAEYDNRNRGQSKDEMVTISHLFFRWGESPDPAEKARVMARAAAARQRIVKGEDFAAVAKEISEGPTAAQGGSLGELARKGLLPELDKALMSIEPGEMSPPVETANGVHVVLLEGRRFKEGTPYAEMRDRIYQDLYQRRVEEQMKLWLEELRASSAVDVRI